MHTLIPRPRRLDFGVGAFDFTGDTAVAAPARLRIAARRLQDVLRAPTGLDLPIRAEGEASVVFVADDTLADEAYVLEVTGAGIRIAAGGPRGALWAVETLRQLLPAQVYRSGHAAGAEWRIPAVRIEDEPTFAWRGLMLDVARHFFPVREVCRLIDQMAAHKLNTLHLHLTDDQGWRLQILAHPRLTETGGWRPSSQLGAPRDSPEDARPHGGFYTQDDAREIVAYAAARGIAVVPEIEMPGHVQAALAAYPELGVGSDTHDTPWTRWGVNHNVLNVEESTIAFFRDVLDEVVDLFPSVYIGIGGDECPKDQWESDPRVQERMRELGVADAHVLQSWFIGRIDAHLTARGRRAFGWDEILEGGLAPGATVASWRGTAGLVAAARAGHDGVACPEDTVYFDYRQSDDPREPIPVQVVTGVAEVLAFDPVPPELEPEFRGRILGGQANVWTEHIDSARRLDYMVFPRACALAEALWTAGERDLTEFQARLDAHLARLDAAGVEYRDPAGPAPWQTMPAVPGRISTRAERAAVVAAMTARLG